MVAFKIRPDAPLTPEGKPVRSPRRRVVVSGSFQLLTESLSVTVRNLSNTGAAFETEGALKVGTEGVLIAGPLDRLATVIWHRRGLYGVKFDEPLHTAHVMEVHRITADDLRHAEVRKVREWYENSMR